MWARKYSTSSKTPAGPTCWEKARADGYEDAGDFLLPGLHGMAAGDAVERTVGERQGRLVLGHCSQSGPGIPQQALVRGEIGCVSTIPSATRPCWLA